MTNILGRYFRTVKMTAAEIRALNDKKNLDDDGMFYPTGDRPDDWYRATQRPGNGSDR